MIFKVCTKAQNHNINFQLWGFLIETSYGDFLWGLLMGSSYGDFLWGFLMRISYGAISFMNQENEYCHVRVFNYIK